jgi:hypothetical protein
VERPPGNPDPKAESRVSTRTRASAWTGACGGVLAALLILATVAGCVGRSGTLPAAAAPDVDGLLFGLDRCRADVDCPSGTCSVGMCVGYLTVSTELARERIAPRLAGASGALREGLVDAARTVLEDPATSATVRGRAADALGVLGGSLATAALRNAVADPSEPVRFFAARALHRQGDAGGTRALREFAAHRAEAIRALAAGALEPAALQGDIRK